MKQTIFVMLIIMIEERGFRATAEKEEVISNILQIVSGIFRQVLPLAHQELLEMDLTAPQLKVVLLLFMNGSVRMSELASALGVSMATATGIVDRLVERELVARENQKSDRRVVMCSLTPEGRDLTTRLWRSSEERAREILRAVDLARLRAIDGALAEFRSVAAAGESSARE
jgi:DNA-binding MarR family transcriptional regulator